MTPDSINITKENTSPIWDMGPKDAHFAREAQIKWSQEHYRVHDSWPTPKQLHDFTLDCVSRGELQITGK